MADYQNEDIAKTIDDSKKVFQLVKDYSKMELLDKGSSILTGVILIIVVISLSAIAVFCLCMALYHCLLSKTNDPVLSYAIIALSLLFICALIVLLKKVLIENPVIKFISNILFKKGG